MASKAGKGLDLPECLASMQSRLGHPYRIMIPLGAPYNGKEGKGMDT